MSLYGALYSGVSGLISQSSAMGAIADNITNVNTTGYKTTNVKFQTLVTKQTALTTYSPGGVMSRPRQNVDEQGLLGATTSSTDLGISGNGFFVVTQNANPTSGDLWTYTRAGSFKMNQEGYLQNSSGYFLQGWTLLPYDGNPDASVVKVGDFYYMKAYKDNMGNTTYINDNIVDSRNLRPINLSTVGGSATPTRNVRIGANLPSSDPVFDSSNSSAGGIHSSSTLIYDSLGNAHNISVSYTKVAENAWDIDMRIPPGSATLVLYSERENTIDATDDVYAAYGQMEFNSIPANHSFIKITDGSDTANPVTYVFEFSENGTNTYVPNPGEVLVTVDIMTGVTSVGEAVQRFNTAIRSAIPNGGRFAVDASRGNRIVFTQSPSGTAVTIDASSCLQCQQASANPDLTTGRPTGIYTIPRIDDEMTNAAIVNFNSTNPASYANTSIILGNNVYEFYDSSAGQVVSSSNNIGVDISSAISGGIVNRESVVSLLMTQIFLNAQEPSRFRASGTSIEILPTETGGDILINTGSGSTGNTLVEFTGQNLADYAGGSIVLNGITYNLVNGGAVAPTDVDISTITSWGTAAAANDVVTAILTAMRSNDSNNSSNVQARGNMLVGSSGTSGLGAATLPNMAAVTSTTTAGIAGAVDGRVKDAGGNYVDLAGESLVLQNSFIFNGTPDAERGARAVGVRFNSDGSPKYFNVTNFSINWANGSQNMSGEPGEGRKISLFLGNVNTNDGLTQLSGEFTNGYTKQDGAKFGSFAGVSISETGIVVALFDNGDTRPIAQIPLATFVNPNGLNSLTGNVWNETDYSGSYTLRTPGRAGAGVISASSLENSITDLGTEFTNMITTQRAYSAAAKVITTADTMLDDLLNIKR